MYFLYDSIWCTFESCSQSLPVTSSANVMRCLGLFLFSYYYLRWFFLFSGLKVPITVVIWFPCMSKRILYPFWPRWLSLVVLVASDVSLSGVSSAVSSSLDNLRTPESSCSLDGTGPLFVIPTFRLSELTPYPLLSWYSFYELRRLVPSCSAASLQSLLISIFY